MIKPELLAPAGNLEKLKVAINYGADSVYLGGKSYGLRAAAGNFTHSEIEDGIKYAHKRDKKVYVTLNIIPHNEDLCGLDDYVRFLNDIDVDGVIVSDPGIMAIVKENAPDMRINLSTQANNTNWKSAAFWHQLGVSRVTVARELSINEIKNIISNTPDTLEIEAFIHGAMCVSYSGRCFLSNYMTYRDSNKGLCTHPCRWIYNLVEEKRPGEYFPVYEDEKGTSIFSSKDLCLIGHIPELIESGINSFKIEGRMKSSYYTAVTVSIYRKAIDKYYDNPDNYEFDPEWLEELKKVVYRKYWNGFTFSESAQEGFVYNDGIGSYTKNYEYVGIILDYDEKTELATVQQNNKVVCGDTVEIIGPDRNYYIQTIDNMWDNEGKQINSAPHAKQIIKVKMNNLVAPLDIIRKKI